jgi:tetratricopeptide (TPR) repeat protein
LGDGGCKQDKFERDIRLLLDGIKEEPNNVRYYFYLANSYHDSGRFGEAINVYKKRIELDGWREEVWYSYYRIGLCFRNMGKIDDAIRYWLDGFNYYQERMEGLYEIIKHYRITSKHKLADMIYQQARKVLDMNHNRDGYLFLHNDVYTSKIYYEYTIVAAYLGVKNINYEIVQIFNHSTDGSIINNTFENMKFYKDILTPKHVYVFDNKMTIEINGENIDFISSSSCLIHKKIKSGDSSNDDQSKYLMNIRYVNYYITENGTYINCEKNIITANKCGIKLNSKKFFL